MSILMCGDPHGSDGIIKGVECAVAKDCTDVIFLGDCWDVDKDYDSPVNVHTIAGNHEDIHKLRHAKTIHHEDFTTFQIGNITFGVIGRIDGVSHLNVKRQKPFLYRAIYASKQPNVEFDADSFNFNCFGDVKIDVLLTHDAPYPMDLHGEPVGSQWLTRVIKHYRPKYAFHGHMHHYDVREIYGCLVMGLDEMTGDNCVFNFKPELAFGEIDD